MSSDVECQVRVYRGSQRDRIVGRPCYNAARYLVSAAGSDVGFGVCAAHRKQYTKRFGFNINTLPPAGGSPS